SSTTTSGRCSRTLRRASSPRDAASTSYPSRRKLIWSSRTMTGSSSTIRMRALGVASTIAAYRSHVAVPADSKPLLDFGRALVAQRIERRPPEPGAQVRVLPRAPPRAPPSRSQGARSPSAEAEQLLAPREQPRVGEHVEDPTRLRELARDLLESPTQVGARPRHGGERHPVGAAPQPLEQPDPSGR